MDFIHIPYSCLKELSHHWRVHIYITIQKFNVYGKISYARQGCIYLIKKYSLNSNCKL